MKFNVSNKAKSKKHREKNKIYDKIKKHAKSKWPNDKKNIKLKIFRKDQIQMLKDIKFRL